MQGDRFVMLLSSRKDREDSTLSSSTFYLSPLFCSGSLVAGDKIWLGSWVCVFHSAGRIDLSQASGRAKDIAGEVQQWTPGSFINHGELTRMSLYPAWYRLRFEK
jgi:hypothetical protein